MNMERADIFFDSMREKYPDYINKLEMEALRTEVPIIRRGTREIIRFFLSSGKYNNVLEIGTAIGYSALVMSEILPKTASVTTVEKVEMRLVEARKNIKQYDKKGIIHLIEGDAADVLKRLTEEGKKYDFIFLDAAKGQYLSFFPYVFDLLEYGGVLISDNVLHGGDILESRYTVKRRDRTIHERMRDYLKLINSHPELNTLCLTEGDGTTISVKGRKK